MDPVAYLRAGYFERWQAGLEMLLVEKGVLSRKQVAARAEWSAGSRRAGNRRVATRNAGSGSPCQPPDRLSRLETAACLRVG